MGRARDVFTEDAVIHYSGTTEHTGIDDIVTFFRTTATSLAATQHLSLTLPGSGPHAKLGVAEALEVHGPDEALVVGNRHDE
ncbi:MAG TPA: nuclear transport factor 2 family protein [Pseudonocardia sp.]|nr:nuclear transport factor 2 family protein [Pseudonocardia sp.]HTF46216.1 nuclear transport factor 2 family protein [Pseudonocardia sp.]